MSTFESEWAPVNSVSRRAAIARIVAQYERRSVIPRRFQRGNIAALVDTTRRREDGSPVASG
jgi:hypothetical protein